VSGRKAEERGNRKEEIGKGKEHKTAGFKDSRTQGAKGKAQDRR
jgi:hypothetical protein